MKARLKKKMLITVFGKGTVNRRLLHGAYLLRNSVPVLRKLYKMALVLRKIEKKPSLGFVE